MRATLIALIALAGCTGSSDPAACREARAPSDPYTVTAPPLAMVVNSHVRLQLETRELVDITVSSDLPDTGRCPSVLEAEANREARNWAWPEAPAELDHPDEAGEHVLHALAWVEDLEPGEAAAWQVPTGPETTWTGTSRRPPLAGGTGRVVFMGSLAPPVQGELAAAAAATDPDVAFLTGDLQDTELAGSTWSALAHDLVPLSATALVHAVPGDRDLEEQDDVSEKTVLFDRWFGDQGRPGSRAGAYAVDVAGVRFVVLDTGDRRLGGDGSAQREYLLDEISRTAQAAEVREVVVVLHAGPYSLAEQRPAYDLQDRLHDELVAAGVRLVVSGHGHLYERFEVDGITYISDGGGGAPLSAPDAREDAEALALRQAVDESHGYLALDIDENGALVLTRTDADGSEVDRVTFEAPGGE